LALVQTLFVVLTVGGLLLALNALRPIPAGTFGPPSFFLGWITSEMAPHWLVLHVLGVGVFVALGAATWVGLVAAVLTAAALVLLIRQSARAESVIADALADAGYRDEANTLRTDPAVRWWHLGLPFRRRRPDVIRVANVAYGEYGKRNRLDVFHHRDMPAGAPIAIQIHGGGWIIGNKEQQGRPLALHLAAHGWVVVVPNYRLSPKWAFPAQLIDIKRAIAWTREHAADFGADPSFVAVTGGSAGGHLAALTALSQNDPAYQPGFEDADTSVQAAVPYYGVYDVTNEAGTRYGRQRLRFLMERLIMQAKYADNRELFDGASPVVRAAAHDPEAIPPFFVIHGAHDSLVPVSEGRLFVERLRAVSTAPVAYAELPGAQHAFDVFGSVRVAHVLRGVERFISAARRSATLR
jgi:acetyl esterase/lipase